MKIMIDAATGLATLERRISGVSFSSHIPLEPLLNAKSKKEAIKLTIRRLKDDGSYKETIKSIKKQKRNLNPVVLELLNKNAIDLDTIIDYIMAVENGDKNDLPFDRYDIKLDGGGTLGITENHLLD